MKLYINTTCILDIAQNALNYKLVSFVFMIVAIVADDQCL